MRPLIPIRQASNPHEKRAGQESHHPIDGKLHRLAPVPGWYACRCMSLWRSNLYLPQSQCPSASLERCAQNKHYCKPRVSKAHRLVFETYGEKGTLAYEAINQDKPRLDELTFHQMFEGKLAS